MVQEYSVTCLNHGREHSMVKSRIWTKIHALIDIIYFPRRFTGIYIQALGPWQFIDAGKKIILGVSNFKSW